jgi:hypothetical protein
MVREQLVPAMAEATVSGRATMISPQPIGLTVNNKEWYPTLRR